MKNLNNRSIAIYLIMFTIFVIFTGQSEPGCDTREAMSPSGIEKAKDIKITTDLNGNTIEQNNISNRLLEDNKPGAIQHLYIISAFSGQVLIYSTVRGKVTSSKKRLSPSMAISSTGGAFRIKAKDNLDFYTDEVLGEDGTYGQSAEYIYWWDSKGIYHQQYIEGCMVHISNQPIATKSIILNLETNIESK